MDAHQSAPYPFKTAATPLKKACAQVVNLTLFASLLGLSLGCGQAQNPVSSSAPESLRHRDSRNLDLSLQIDPVGNGGTYRVSGRTNLPDTMTLTIAAVRPLVPQKPAAGEAEATYAILDYQSVTVTNGQWQTTLNLWEVAPNGAYQESWQRQEAEIDLKVTPDPNVQFLATLATPDELETVAQTLDQAGLAFPQPMMRTTVAGEPYLQIQEAVAIALPTTHTTPPAQSPSDINGGWGERYLLVAEPPVPSELETPGDRQTNAPAKLDEYMY